MVWVFEYVDDLDADFRAFYNFPASSDEPGIADGHFGRLTLPRFIRMAERVFAFNGVMAARALQEKEKKEPTRENPRPVGPQKTAQEKVHVRLSQLMLLDPTLIQYETV